MSNKKGVIITFDSAQQAMHGEAQLLQKSIAVTLIVTPRAVSSNCGFSLQVIDISPRELYDLLCEFQITHKDLYTKTHREGVVYYEKY